jgi:hypothetical protein
MPKIIYTVPVIKKSVTLIVLWRDQHFVILPCIYLNLCVLCKTIWQWNVGQVKVAFLFSSYYMNLFLIKLCLTLNSNISRCMLTMYNIAINLINTLITIADVFWLYWAFFSALSIILYTFQPQLLCMLNNYVWVFLTSNFRIHNELLSKIAKKNINV